MVEPTFSASGLAVWQSPPTTEVPETMVLLQQVAFSASGLTVWQSPPTTEAPETMVLLRQVAFSASELVEAIKVSPVTESAEVTGETVFNPF